jgi:flagellar assembly protein FliH
MTTSQQSAPASVQKFQFDEFEGEDLSDSMGDLAIAELVEASYSQEDMDAAKIVAQAEGYARGAADTDAAIEGDIARLLQRIAEASDAAVADQNALRETIGSEAVRLAALIARKVLPALAEAGALTEIEALIARCLGERPEESRLVIRIHDTMLDKVQAKMATIVGETGFMGKPILLADPSLQKTEVRIEWANGGVDWSFSKQLADIEAACRQTGVRPARTAKTTRDAAHDDSPMADIVDAEIVGEQASSTENESE